MKSSLKAALENLGPCRDVDRVPFGSPEVFVLQMKPGEAAPHTINLALSLAKRGITLLRAKRATEEMLARGRVCVSLPKVEDRSLLKAELEAAGIAACHVDTASTPDVLALRQRLNMTREQFATTYGFDVETLRNWEAGRREPDLSARSYLRAIENDPEKVEQAYAPIHAS